jgi:Tol biopolymer transport system component
MRSHGLLIAATLVLSACGGDPVSPSPGHSLPQASASRDLASVESSANESTSPGVAAGGIVQALVDGIRVRAEPGLDGTAIARLSAGQRARVADGPEEADGYRWYQLSLMPSGVSGWVAAGEGSTPWIATVINGRITGASGRDIWTVDQNGNRERLAEVREGWYAADPSWAPNGAALAISELHQDADLGCIVEGGIAVLDDTGRVVARSSPPPGTFDSGPRWSPDSSQIGFTRSQYTCGVQAEPGPDGLYIMDAIGGNERLVVSNAPSAVWSPTGDTFAFVRFNDQRGWEIWLVAADGSGERLLGGRGESLIGWSPDGSVLAYIRNTDAGDLQVDVIDPAGDIRTLKTYPGLAGIVTQATWLPDGSGLAFYVQDVPGFTINVVVLSSSGEEFARFEQPDGVPSRVIVSPDGSTLAWGIQGSSDLRIQPIAGGDARTFSLASNFAIDWQPLLLP